MACFTNHTLKGIQTDCAPSLAGIKEAYFAYADSVLVSAYTTGVSAQTIDNITSASTGTDSKPFRKYEFNKQTGSLTSTLTKDETNGTRYYTNTATLQFTKMESKKHLEVEAMAAEHLVGIIADNNGKYWYLGYDSYLSTDEATAQSGQSFDDLNGYNLTLNAMSAYLPFEIKYSQFSSLIHEESQQTEG